MIAACYILVSLAKTRMRFYRVQYRPAFLVLFADDCVCRSVFIRTEICRFSGARIYPGHGMLYIRTDSQNFRFLNAKCKRLFHLRLKPANLAWTQMYRKQHKKGQTELASKKKRKAVKATLARGIAGASLEVIQKKRTEKTEVRQAARDAALR